MIKRSFKHNKRINTIFLTVNLQNKFPLSRFRNRQQEYEVATTGIKDTLYISREKCLFLFQFTVSKKASYQNRC